MSYELSDFLRMMQDPVRVNAYRDAIRRVVRPGDVVVDVGAGVGLLSLLALEAGARHVYAVDTNDAVDLLAALAREGPYAGSLTTYRMDSRAFTPLELADVIIADLRGALPLVGDSAMVMVDARRRFLRPGGTIIPHADTLHVAPVASPDSRAVVEGWRRLAATTGVDFSGLATIAANQARRHALSADAVLAEPAELGRLEYATLEPGDLALQHQFHCSRNGALTGLGTWFTSEMAPGVTLSSAPFAPPTVYQQMVFPMEGAYSVQEGDVLDVELRAVYAGGHYLWFWKVGTCGGSGNDWSEQHSSIRASVLDVGRLRRRTAGFRPTPNRDAQIDTLILTTMNGHASLGEISERLVAQFPGEFADWHAALERVSAIAETYGE